MPICPNCGGYVSEGSPICSCGSTLSGGSSNEEIVVDLEEIKERIIADEYYRQAESLKRDGRYAEAIQMYGRSRDMGNPELTGYDIGLLCYEMGDYERALEFFRKCGDMGRSYQISRMIGKALAGLGSYHEAIHVFFKTLDIIEKSDEFIQDYKSLNFGVYHTKEELDRRAMEKRSKKRKEKANLYNEIALAYRDCRDLGLARRYADEAPTNFIRCAKCGNTWRSSN